jgi:excinuclease ABC subunit C
LLKDDKSFAYIKLRQDHDFPQLVKYRGKDTGNGFFGPFASVQQVDMTLVELQKIFKIRPCSDHYFATRLRPCLQYQIKRCYAPCVKKISKEEYRELVEQATAFLSGKNQQLQEELAKKMDSLSQNMRFEEAAEIRDRIKSLSYVQLKSGLTGSEIKNADIIAVAHSFGVACVQVFLYRAGQFCGNKAYFPIHTENSDNAEIMSAFIGQYYQQHQPAEEIFISCSIDDQYAMEEALKKSNSTKVKILVPKRGIKLKLLTNAIENANSALNNYLKNSTKDLVILAEVKNLFSLTDDIERIEVYDNSHITGSHAVGAMIVATASGFNKKEYRIFTINGENDDYSMLKNVLTRRFIRLQKEPDKEPSLIIIDGGRGHLSTALEVMQQFGFEIPLVCMSKGVDRNAGREQFHLPGRESFTLDKNSKLMQYLQILRDEAHNFAINAHRRKRSKAIKISSLDDITGIGEIRKKALLNYFGSFKAITEASIEDLQKVPNISKQVATRIYEKCRRSLLL